jgi:chromosome segregation ATPase
MLDQAIVDAKALKEAAIKSAESTIIEKYSQEIRDAVDTMLATEELVQEEEGVVASIPMAASDVASAPAPSEQEVIELDFAELEQMIDQELAAEEEADAAEMTDRHEFAEDELEGDKEELQENDEIDLNNLFEDEEINLDEETIEAIAEKLTLDFQPVKSGNLGMPDSQKQMAYDEAEALNAHIDEEEEASDELAKEIGKLRESIETLESEKKELQGKFQSLQSNTKHVEDVVLKLKNALNETSVQNAKLLYTNKALTSDSLNGRQKDKIVEAISNAKTVEEAKVIFETLQSTVSGTKKESPKTLSEAVSRKSTLLPQTKEAKQPADPRINRMQRLAGLN